MSPALFKDYFSSLATSGQGILIARHIYGNIACSSVEIEKVPEYNTLIAILSECENADLFIRYEAEFFGLLDCLCCACSPEVKVLGDSASREEQLDLAMTLLARPVVGDLLTQIHKGICGKINTTLGTTSSLSASTIKRSKENVFADFLTAVYCGVFTKDTEFNEILQDAIAGVGSDCATAANRLRAVADRIDIPSE
jgi:hypothetical protein